MNIAEQLSTAATKIMTLGATALFFWFVAFLVVTIQRSRAEAEESANEVPEYHPAPRLPADLEDEPDQERGRR